MRAFWRGPEVDAVSRDQQLRFKQKSNPDEGGRNRKGRGRGRGGRGGKGRGGRGRGKSLETEGEKTSDKKGQRQKKAEESGTKRKKGEEKTENPDIEKDLETVKASKRKTSSKAVAESQDYPAGWEEMYCADWEWDYEHGCWWWEVGSKSGPSAASASTAKVKRKHNDKAEAKSSERKPTKTPKTKVEDNSKSTKNANTEDETVPKTPTNSTQQIYVMKEFALQFKYMKEDTHEHRTTIREQLYDSKTCKLNIYWTTCRCGVKHIASGKDFTSYMFSRYKCPWVFKMLVAIAAGQMLVTCPQLSP